MIHFQEPIKVQITMAGIFQVWQMLNRRKGKEKLQSKHLENTLVREEINNGCAPERPLEHKHAS